MGPAGVQTGSTGLFTVSDTFLSALSRKPPEHLLLPGPARASPRRRPQLPSLCRTPAPSPETQVPPTSCPLGCLWSSLHSPGAWGCLLGVGTPLSRAAGAPLTHCFLGGSEARGSASGAGRAEGTGNGGLLGPQVSSPPAATVRAELSRGLQVPPCEGLTRGGYGESFCISLLGLPERGIRDCAI